MYVYTYMPSNFKFLRACKSGFFSDFFYFNKIKYILNTFFHFTKIKYICCIFRGMKNYPKTQIKNYQKRYEITACLWWCLAGILCTVILYSTPVLFAVQRWGTIFIADVKMCNYFICEFTLFETAFMKWTSSASKVD